MKIAVITGASSGIGKELAIAIDKTYRYDEIWLIARRKEKLEELAAQCRNRVRSLALDLTRAEDISVCRQQGIQ